VTVNMLSTGHMSAVSEDAPNAAPPSPLPPTVAEGSLPSTGEGQGAAVVTTAGQSGLRAYLDSPLCQLVCTPVYTCTVVGLSALFFVVTGIQFWITIFLQLVIGADPAAVIAVFGVTSITAPVFGVIVGGVVTDRYGGYKGAEGIKRTLTFCMCAGACAAFASVLCSFLPQLATGRGTAAYNTPGNPAGVALTVGLIAVVLFFGGMTIPAANGVLIASVRPDLRQLASSGSIFFFQQFGYFLAPLLSGAIASSATPDIDEALSALTNATERQLIQASRVGPDRARFDAFEALETEGAQANVAFVTVMNWALVGMALFVWARVFAGANAARERAALAAVARSQREAASHKQAAASQRERL